MGEYAKGNLQIRLHIETNGRLVAKNSRVCIRVCVCVGVQHLGVFSVPFNIFGRNLRFAYKEQNVLCPNAVQINYANFRLFRPHEDSLLR